MPNKLVRFGHRLQLQLRLISLNPVIFQRCKARSVIGTNLECISQFRRRLLSQMKRVGRILDTDCILTGWDYHQCKTISIKFLINIISVQKMQATCWLHHNLLWHLTKNLADKIALPSPPSVACILTLNAILCSFWLHDHFQECTECNLMRVTGSCSKWNSTIAYIYISYTIIVVY